MLDTERSRSSAPRALLARVRALLARSPTLHRWYDRYRVFEERLRTPVDRSFWELPPRLAVRLAYNVTLRREPDPRAWDDFEARLTQGEVTRERMVEELCGSDEFGSDIRFTSLGHSIHVGRRAFIRSLPRARRILDLGGTHLAHEHGALVRMGYPYRFERLVIVDLPAGERHPIYRDDVVSGRDAARRDVTTPLGPVTYRYHSMTDLSPYDDASFDLVYMGQSIEHVTEEEGAHVLEEVFRVLAPGGWLALDTPNGRVTRRQQPDFIDPDHKVEYTLEELTAKLTKAGFTIVETKGLNYAGAAADASSTFSLATVAANAGVFAEAHDCYILALLCAR